jgi:hypothetical protein
LILEIDILLLMSDLALEKEFDGSLDFDITLCGYF